MDYALAMLRTSRESVAKDQAAEIVERVKALHVDQMENETAWSFVKRYGSEKEYTFLALKTKVGWFTTGRTEDPLSNDTFEELLASKHGFSDFQRLVPYNPPMDVQLPSSKLISFDKEM
jgi:hypothetical protein